MEKAFIIIVLYIIKYASHVFFPNHNLFLLGGFYLLGEDILT